jgi:signal transduction histidine kinase
MEESGAPIAIADIQRDDDWIKLPGDERLHACVAAPVRLQEHTIGFISLLSAEPDRFESVNAQHLHVFTAQAATAIQNAQHYEQSRELVAIEERQRIARDLHDAVTQSLFSANIIAQSLPRLWKRNPERVVAELDTLHELTDSALTEMRMLLMELRPEALRDVALSELLRRLALALQTRKQIPISLSVDELPDLPEEVKTAFYRIAQESLNNAAKHARPTHIDLHVRCHDSHLTLLVRDNGIGFASKSTAPMSYGLNIMHERSQEIGAQLQIESQQGNGTTVTVIWSGDSQALTEA